MPRKYYAGSLFVALLGAALFSVAKPAPSDLDISPTFQQTPVWCWAASAEMVLTYYDIPDLNPVGDFQCAIAALVSPACVNNCAKLPDGRAQYVLYAKRPAKLSGRCRKILWTAGQ
jgi:hypothetical protein